MCSMNANKFILTYAKYIMLKQDFNILKKKKIYVMVYIK